MCFIEKEYIVFYCCEVMVEYLNGMKFYVFDVVGEWLCEVCYLLVGGGFVVMVGVFNM